MHLLIVCLALCWHTTGSKYAVAGSNIVEINLVSLPVKKSVSFVKNGKGNVIEPSAAKSPQKVVKVSTHKKTEPDVSKSPKINQAAKPSKPIQTPAVIQNKNTIPDSFAESFNEPVLSSSLISMSGSISADQVSSDTNNDDLTDSLENSASGIPGGEPEAGISGRQRYIDENFYYVKDLITGSLEYPIAARRMKWQGTVVVSFVVLENGSVKNIKIVNSSGHSMLDKNVITAIKKVQPFPPPPADAEFTMPIKYTLNL